MIAAAAVHIPWIALPVGCAAALLVLIAAMCRSTADGERRQLESAAAHDRGARWAEILAVTEVAHIEFDGPDARPAERPVLTPIVSIESLRARRHPEPVA